jgi:L-alanine-DL-glutamate epimerase-like enolase superfamily enzyme
VQVRTRIVELELAQTFSISYSTFDVVEVVHVEIEHEGERGFGEAAPFERYGEDAASAQAFIEQHSELLGDDPFAFAAIEERLAQLPGEMAAKAALDAALHDLQGKLLRLPVWRLLGLRADGPPTSYTVVLDDPDEMARRAERDARRFRRLKLKLGGRDGLDADRVRAVRAVSDLPLQVDANEAWSLDEALEIVSQLAELGVEYCEQPLRAEDPGGGELRRRSPIPIYVDEDCHTLASIAPCSERAHGVNIKLAKSGGIREALRMVHAARALGLGVMLGCMLESGLGIAAAAQIASLCNHVDLDGNLLLRRDPWPGVELREGVQVPSGAPGLGVQPAHEHVRE